MAVSPASSMPLQYDSSMPLAAYVDISGASAQYLSGLFVYATEAYEVAPKRTSRRMSWASYRSMAL